MRLNVNLMLFFSFKAKYHEDFNKSKGKFTVVADDPALTRAKEHQRIVSQAEYTGKRKESSGQIISNGEKILFKKVNLTFFFFC